MAIVLEESAAPPPPTAAITAEEEQAVEETTVDEAALAPPAWTGSGGEDVVMVPVDDGSAPPPPVREHDVATLAALESSAAVAATPIEGAADALSSRYVDFPGIRIIDFDATELPSNDQEILEAAMERMFTDRSVLDAIMSVLLVPRQEDCAGGSALLTVDYRIKVHMDLQADKSPVVVKGPFFHRVVNPMYRIRGTMCNARIQSSKAMKAIY
jgi:hypothetical protein